MSRMKYFLDNTCPKCSSRAFYRLGDEHSLSLPLVIESGDESAATPNIDLYVKVCKHCAYTEVYAKKLIDRFEELDDAGGFGRILKAESGGYIVSVFTSYSHGGRKYTDFSFPISSEMLFELSLMVDSLGNAEFVLRMMGEDYILAWTQRVGKTPDDLADNLRALVKDFNAPKE